MLINFEKRRNYDQSKTRKRRAAGNRNVRKHRIRVYVDKRIVPLGDSFTVNFTIPSPNVELHVENLDCYKIIDGPHKSTGLYSDRGVLNVVTKVTYELLPLKSGYLPIGPAHAVKGRQRYSSGGLHVRIVPQHFGKARSSKIKLKSKSKLLIAATFLLFTILFFNLVNLEQPDPVKPKSHRHLYDPVRLQNGTAPFDAHFGVGHYEAQSYNTVVFNSENNNDVVVCLVRISTNEVIRNAYIKARSRHEMRNLPDGFYYIKVYSGQNWSENKELKGANVKGGFAWKEEFKVYDKPSLYIKLNQFSSDKHVFYTDFEVTLYATDKSKMAGELISSREFFE